VKGDVPPVNSMFVGDDAFFKEINKFDSAKIEEQAKSYKCQL
jgi:hypothetical protein